MQISTRSRAVYCITMIPHVQRQFMLHCKVISNKVLTTFFNLVWNCDQDEVIIKYTPWQNQETDV